MNRFLLLTTAAAVLGGMASVGPACAELMSPNGTSADSRSAQQLVNDAAQTVQKIKSDSRFDNLLKQAKGVYIMPDLVKGAFVVGGEGAQGVLLKHESDGSWSNPAFLTIGSISLGAQAGGKAGPAAMILMTDKALSDFTQSTNFSINASAGLTIVNYSAQGQASVGKGDIVLWSDQSGAFAGADLSGASISQNTSEDHTYYGKSVNTDQILEGNASNAKAETLRSGLPS